VHYSEQFIGCYVSFALCVELCPPAEAEAADKDATTRYNVYKEVYTSEASYVGFLQVILKVFVKPLQE
jgi:hypothetical protein